MSQSVVFLNEFIYMNCQNKLIHWTVVVCDSLNQFIQLFNWTTGKAQLVASLG